MENFFEIIESEQFISGNSTVLDEIKTAAGVSAEVFKNFYLPVLISFNDSVQLLPFSRAQVAVRGGAAKVGLSSAVFGLRYASSVMFFNKAMLEERRILEPQCRFMTFVSVLASVVAIVTQNVNIFSEDEQFHPLMNRLSLKEWIRRNANQKKLEWRLNVNLKTYETAAIAANFVPRGLFEHFDLEVISMFYSSIAAAEPANGIETMLAKVSRETVTKVASHLQQLSLKEVNIDTASVSIPEEVRMDISLSHQSDTSSASIQKTEVHLTSPTNKSPVVQEPELNLEQLLASINPVLKDWFKEFKNSSSYDVYKSVLRVNELGVEVPLSILGKFGMSATKVRDYMVADNLVVGRTEDSKGIYLKKVLEPLLLGDQIGS